MHQLLRRCKCSKQFKLGEANCTKVKRSTVQLLNNVIVASTQGDHFPDHMKFPTFPVEASKDYPVLSVYRYGQQSLFHINEKQDEAR